MTDDKKKDIVEEVFSKSMKNDERVSALFKCIDNSPQSPLEPQSEDKPSDLIDSTASTDTEPSDNMNIQPPKPLEEDTTLEATIKSKPNRQRSIVAITAVILIGVTFIVARNFIPFGKAATETMPQTTTIPEPAAANKIAAQPQTQSLPDSQLALQSDPVLEESIVKDTTPFVWAPVIQWHSLLTHISATIPKTIHLSAIESADSSKMSLNGAALSSDVMYKFADALRTARQITSAKLTRTYMPQKNSKDLSKFSIKCSLLPETNSAVTLDADLDTTAFDTARLFTLNEAKKFFVGIDRLALRSGCTLKSLNRSQKDAFFHHEKTNTQITQKNATLTLTGGYQDIVRTVEKIQDRTQTVYFDAVNITQAKGSLNCTLVISIYLNDPKN